MKAISTHDAPAAIGTYSQAIRAGDTVYLSGQIPLDPGTMQIVPGGFEDQVQRVFKNLRAVCRAAGGDFDRVARLTIFLTDLANFPKVNEVMATYFREPYPARVTVGVSALPRGAQVEIDAVMHLGPQGTAADKINPGALS